MKPANNGPVYAAMYADLAEVCRKHGYALTIHGSLARDFDVVAVPWIEEPSQPQAVIDEITGRFSIRQIGEPQKKLHGRIAYTVSIVFGSTALDFSFMPICKETDKQTKTVDDPRKPEQITEDHERADKYAKPGSVQHLLLRLGFFPNNEREAEDMVKNFIEDSE